MKYLSLLIAAFTLASCHQQTTTKQSESGQDNRTMDMEVKTMTDTAKQFLINISNNAWFQVQMAQVILKKTNDTSLLNLAENISRQYTRIKDKAKIASVPYRLNMPYFLTHDQNAAVDSLATLNEHSLQKGFIRHCSDNDEIILQECAAFEPMVKDDSDMVNFIRFSRDVVGKNQLQLQKVKK